MGGSERSVDHQSPPGTKIALFRSLFRGRDDVYPRRFESRRTGKAGYAPACANEWVRWHLSGQDEGGRPFVAGVYPMLQDETCFFLAVDFDKEHWHDDSAAFLETCRLLDIPAALERSRSAPSPTRTPCRRADSVT